MILYNPKATKNKYLKSYEFDSEWDGKTFAYQVTPNKCEACQISLQDRDKIKQWLPHWIFIKGENE